MKNQSNFNTHLISLNKAHFFSSFNNNFSSLTNFLILRFLKVIILIDKKSIPCIASLLKWIKGVGNFSEYT